MQVHSHKKADEDQYNHYNFLNHFHLSYRTQYRVLGGGGGVGATGNEMGGDARRLA